VSYSFSRLTTYELCPKKFRFRYIDGLTGDEPKKNYQKIGKAVHDAIASILLGNDIEQSCNNSAEKHGVDLITVLDMANSPLVKERIGQSIENVEVEFEETIPSGRKVHGFIDLITEKEIIDWKTGFKEADVRQLKIYAIHAISGRKEIKAGFGYLATNTLKFIKITKDEIDETMHWIDTTAENIEKDLLYSEKKGPHCVNCEYRRICNGAETLTPEQIAKKIEHMQRLIEIFHESLRDYIAQNGPVETEDCIWELDPRISWDLDTEKIFEDIKKQGNDPLKFANITATTLKTKLKWDEDTLKKYGIPKTVYQLRRAMKSQ